MIILPKPFIAEAETVDVDLGDVSIHYEQAVQSRWQETKDRIKKLKKNDAPPSIIAPIQAMARREATNIQFAYNAGICEQLVKNVRKNVGNIAPFSQIVSWIHDNPTIVNGNEKFMLANRSEVVSDISGLISYRSSEGVSQNVIDQYMSHEDIYLLRAIWLTSGEKEEDATLEKFLETVGEERLAEIKQQIQFLRETPWNSDPEEDSYISVRDYLQEHFGRRLMKAFGYTNEPSE